MIVKAILASGKKIVDLGNVYYICSPYVEEEGIDVTKIARIDKIVNNWVFISSSLIKSLTILDLAEIAQFMVELD